MVTLINKSTDLKEINKKISQLKGVKKFDSKKHSGVIKLEEDPLIVQDKLRNDWK